MKLKSIKKKWDKPSIVNELTIEKTLGKTGGGADTNILCPDGVGSC